MGVVLTTANGKGGVGKTTVTRMIGEDLADRDYTICIIDFCQNSSIATSFLKDRDSYTYTSYEWLVGEAKASQVIQQYTERLHFIPSNERIGDFPLYAERMNMKKRLNFVNKKVSVLRDFYDFILIDTHPSENDDLVSFSFVASDYVVIPFEVDEDSRLSVKRTVEIVEDFKEEGIRDYFLIPNKVTSTNFKVNRQLKAIKKDLVRQNIKEQSFLSKIRNSTTVSTAKNEQTPLKDLANKSRYAKNVLKDFHTVTDEILTVINGGETNER